MKFCDFFTSTEPFSSLRFRFPLLQVKASAADMSKRLSQADRLSGEFRSRIDELTRELQGVTGDRQALLAEVPRLKTIADEAQRKLEVTLRENKQMSGIH